MKIKPVLINETNLFRNRKNIQQHLSVWVPLLRSLKAEKTSIIKLYIKAQINLLSIIKNHTYTSATIFLTIQLRSLLLCFPFVKRVLFASWTFFPLLL